MALELKNKGENPEGEEQLNIPDDESKFRGGYGNGKVSADQLNDLPTYTAPPVMPTSSGGSTRSGASNGVVSKIIAAVVIVAVILVFVKLAMTITGSGGKDITPELTKTEDEIASDLGITFSENNDRVGKIPQYAKSKVTVNSGDELHIVYIGGKQVGVNTDSRKYRFFDVGINDSEKNALKKMTYTYDDSMVVLNDLMGGNSTTYFYYNNKDKDGLVLTISEKSGRVVSMTYYTDFKKATANLESTDD